MKKKDFLVYQRKMIEKFNSIIQSNNKGYVDEQGLPSYTNPNPFMRWFVWKRVKEIIQIFESLGEIENVLDFGCGYGVFHPFLLEISNQLTAYDLMIDDLIALNNSTKEKFVSNIIYESKLSIISNQKNKFNVILAAEVLEHIDELVNLLDIFYDILDDKGYIIVSGPTENYLYKLGRKFANYSGDYHLRNIYQIREILQKKFKVRKISTIVPLLPIYEIYICSKLI